MEIVTGALPSVINKLGELLVGEYNLQKSLKGEIRFLKSELESIKVALEMVSSMLPDQLDKQNKIWAWDLGELAYDIEDQIDKFKVRVKGRESAELHGIRKFIDGLDFFRKIRIRHKIATEIRDIKNRVLEVHERRRRYDVNLCVNRPTTSTVVDPRLSAQYTEAKELVGIDETRDELIKLLMDGNGVPLQKCKIVSIVGFGGLGKTTLAKAVYEKIRGLFDCCAFVSVSQTPDLKKLLKGLLYNLGKNINEETLDEGRLIDVAREFLKTKRGLIVIDDIWDITIWKQIKCALPENGVGYAVITTTRIVHVAEKAGGSYKLNPLSMNNSKKLLYRRVFGHENYNNIEDTQKCPDEELAEVSDRILKKCAGVPLAIITMASLLARKKRNKMDWYEVYHSIGTGLEHNLDVENMRKILSLSYYNMPFYMRTCLLYLGMFPEDYKVQKDCLIWMWIAEGFIQCEGQGKSLFELGESYFNELINRSMIQPIYDKYDMVYGCRVHDMVLDLICSISSEANFATILNGKSHMSSSNGKSHMSSSSKIRRLSIQNGKEDDESMTLAQRSLQQVRSVIVLRSTTSQIPAISSFLVLRVLHLNYCDLSEGYNLNKCIGNLFHLRYLGLRSTHIVELPEEISNLQFLQVLDIRFNKISCLPTNVFLLKHLIRLNMDSSTRVAKGIGSLTCLEELSELGVDESNIDIIEELVRLTELRVLHIFSLNVSNDKLVECLHKLQKIQDITMWTYDSKLNAGALDAWVPPRHLRHLSTWAACTFSKLPTWMNQSHLSYLSTLSIDIREIEQGDFDVLGRLPALRRLFLSVGHDVLGILRGFVVGADSFGCLTFCKFIGFARPIVFQQGAMPRLRSLHLFQLSVREANEMAIPDGVGLDIGLGLLPSLQYINVRWDSRGTSNEEEKELKAALLHASKIHPNHPVLQINGILQTEANE